MQLKTIQLSTLLRFTLPVLLACSLVGGCASAPVGPAMGETAAMEQGSPDLAMGVPHAEKAVFRTEAKKLPKPAPQPDIDADALLKLGPGDALSVQVFGRPEMSTSTYVSDDGTIEVPLAGTVQVAGLTPAKASNVVAKALKDGQYLNDPHVSITLTSYKSAQVSVLGEIHTPGRFTIESRTTALDLVAQAGGPTENAADVIYVLRPDGKGNVARFVVDLNSLRGDDGTLSTLSLRGGDSVYIPRAEQFYIYGEVHTPNVYKLEPGMNVLQAVARGGGVTPRGSQSRIEISRREPDGSTKTLSAKPTDVVQPNDVIRVKERIF